MWLLIANCFLISCSKDVSDDTGIDHDLKDQDFKQEMRNFVIGISNYSKEIKPDFNIIPQNGIELVTKNGESTGIPDQEYLNSIDGNGQEDLFYGYDEDDKATAEEQTNYLKKYLDISKAAGKKILVTDYCSTANHISNSKTWNQSAGYTSYAAISRELDVVPNYALQGENNQNIQKLSDIKNFLYLINPAGFSSKQEFINKIKSTNYDLLILDLYFTDGKKFTSEEVSQLKKKANGGKRLVIAYMSIGEAENYRPYWNSSWNSKMPTWISAENPDWKGNFKVKYWDKEWQSIIFGNDNSYSKAILDANFDGVYLDIIDAFEYFENQ